MKYEELKATEDFIKKNINDMATELDDRQQIHLFTFNLVWEINKIRKKYTLPEFK